MENVIKVYCKNSDQYKMVQKDQTFNKQLSTIEEKLAHFGLLKNEIRVYLHLARSGKINKVYNYRFTVIDATQCLDY